MPVRGVVRCLRPLAVCCLPQQLKRGDAVVFLSTAFGFVRSLPSGAARLLAHTRAAETFRGNVMKANVFNTLIFSAAMVVLAGCNQNAPAPGTGNNATAPAATPAPAAPGAPGAPGTEAPAVGAPGAPAEPGAPGAPAPGAPAPDNGTGGAGGAPAPAPAP